MIGNSRTRCLALWMNGERVGNWYLSSAGEALEYASSWIASRQARPLSLQAGGTYQLTPLYDLMSAYPLLGAGPERLSPFKVKLAMAVRSKNTHWRMREVLRRHWLAMGDRYGVVSPEGLHAETIVDDLAARTPDAAATWRPRIRT